MSKVDELTYDRELTYSDEGQLIGHLVMAVSLLEGKVREAEKLSGELFPRELVLRLKHVIVSHHGEYEYGSPKLPMTLEAVALYCLDNLDAKVAAFSQQMRDDPERWKPVDQLQSDPGAEAVQRQRLGRIKPTRPLRPAPRRLY